MRIAFVAMGFYWPLDEEAPSLLEDRGFHLPMSGREAHVDLHHTILGLQGAGHETHLFAVTFSDMWRHSGFEPEQLPYPATALPIAWAGMTNKKLGQLLRRAVDSWKPDAVFVGFARRHKPHMLEALAGYPIINRYYLHEPLCLADTYMYRGFQICPNDLLRTPNVCRYCALRTWSLQIKAAEPILHADELLRTGALKRHYHQLHKKTLADCRSVIVYNETARERLDGYCADIRTIPFGVNAAEFRQTPLADKPPSARKVIFMPGNADHFLNGAYVLAEAGRRLAMTRTDFEIRVIAAEDLVQQPWFTAYNWQDPEGVQRLYDDADIIVVPSVWSEPSGRTAIEGMAAGRPVVASRVGALQQIVRDGETGRLFERESSRELSECLGRMLDDSDLRARMGGQARRTALAEYDWDRIIETHYPPLLEAVTS